MVSRGVLHDRVAAAATLLPGQEFTHLGNRDHRQIPDEQEEQREEQPERADHRRVVPHRRSVTAPCGRDVLATQRNHDDIALEPHSNEDRDTDQLEPEGARAEALEPQEREREEAVEEDQAPV